MPSASTLTERLRRVAPEALAFGIIGAGNTLLYMAITYVLLDIGAVKASVIGTVITTSLAYLANRYWTYRNHTRTALRREYTLFFGFNLIGMLIQSGAIAIGKYGFGLTEEHDELLFMTVTVIGIGIATIFRFWAYRTFVFLKPPVDGHEAAITELDATAGLAELSAVEEPNSVARLDLQAELDAR
ncbi:putative GtrA-like protein [Actinoplanes missouriensis 431]|uniref:Putative GtrA-like protein n=1 Tax=Actinoplanes missouriensis (strain ATCC 14538 / DSM 43046 / CBS 188.64 / JCM 3121 / NBRC 102363 / NCIMB 12654 / NRRL B-3342 / UNCC 431) TaxID=512565 RepID=I0HI23_ACTM4|nr:GtrA family protein [Actinoplanes missouriensis]BAL92660.1 putative GtrA-like protein [Actinoplanes missouriensis 431]